VLFDEANSTQIPTSSGIYAFCVEPHITDSLGACFVMYFGQANNLKRRYGEYTREIRAKQGAGRPYVKRMKRYVSREKQQLYEKD
jgi:excinuclease UvrABC nuclease subunit